MAGIVGMIVIAIAIAVRVVVSMLERLVKCCSVSSCPVGLVVIMMQAIVCGRVVGCCIDCEQLLLEEFGILMLRLLCCWL